MVDGKDEREARVRLLLGLLLADVYEDECAAELLRDSIRRQPEMAGAHVELGFVLGRAEDYEGMVGAFQEALRIDRAAVRASIHKDSAELVLLKRILYPELPVPAPAKATPVLAVPDYVREGGALVSLAREQIGAGRDDEAVVALEAALRLDETYQYAAALLSLTYLIIREGRGVVPKEGEGSVLWVAEPALAELLFGEWGAGRQSHTKRWGRPVAPQA